MNALLEQCKPANSRRFITQKEYPDKAMLLKAHQQADNSIIVAPAMHEGLNLIDDLSRFQIICKVPYANFYDNKQLARRVEVDQKYYTWLTALKLIQSYGRSIRSENDFADTYVIDEAILRFITDAKSMLPTWFTEAIIYK
jgi:Rad3-related DNA helicase